MSLSKENKYPEIRFKGFTKAWEQRKLSKVVNVMDGDRGKSYPSKDDFSNKEHTLFLSANNVTKEGFSFKKNQYITEERSNTLGNGKLKHNDIILTSRGSVGHIAWYSRKVESKVPHARINSGMLILRSNNNIEANFISQYLKSPIGKRQIDLISFGSAQPQLTKKDVSNYNISLPDRQEQLKLGKFFTDLDKTIALHQEKLDKLHKLKKGYLQVMFPQKDVLIPKVRFTEFKNDWRERKINDISTKTFGGGTPKTSITEYWNGSIPWIQSSDLTEHNLSNVNVRKYISETGLAKSAAKMVPNNSIAIVTRVGVGKLSLVPFYYATSQDFLSLSNLNVDIWFGVYLLYNKLQKEMNSVQGTSIKGITKKELLNKEIMVPMKIEEQIKIGNFFKKIDSIILYQQNKLNNLQGIKKSYLQKMFV